MRRIFHNRIYTYVGFGLMFMFMFILPQVVMFCTYVLHFFWGPMAAFFTCTFVMHDILQPAQPYRSHVGHLSYGFVGTKYPGTTSETTCILRALRKITAS